MHHLSFVNFSPKSLSEVILHISHYFRHSEDLIKRLEQAGLGYHVSAKDTADKLGKQFLHIN